jgi:hypothetical protein
MALKFYKVLIVDNILFLPKADEMGLEGIVNLIHAFYELKNMNISISCCFRPYM